jgi:hypothetical protein
MRFDWDREGQETKRALFQARSNLFHRGKKEIRDAMRCKSEFSLAANGEPMI